MRITYKDLETKSYSQLIKEGATKEQIQTKVSNYYLKEQRVLTINEKEGKTLSRAIKLLKKGNVSQGTWIHETMLDKTKSDVKLLKQITKIIGKDSFAGQLLNEFQRGEKNPYQLHSAMQKYASNPTMYENDNNIDEIELLVDGYNN